MDFNFICLIAFFILIIIGNIFYYIKHPMTFESLEKKIEKDAYMLFLAAEKQGLIGSEKLDWCINKLLQQSNIKNVDEKLVKAVAQHLYDNFKEYENERLNIEQKS